MCFRATHLLAWIGCLVCCSACAQYEIPERPHPKLPDFDDPFWEKKANWPESLTNQGVIYTLNIHYGFGDKEVRTNVFPRTARVAAGVLSAEYVVGLPGFRQLPKPNSGQIGYGPEFSWRPDGTVRRKGFRYENGFWFFACYDRNGKVWWKSFTDYEKNQTTWVLYNAAGEIIGYLMGKHVDEEPYRGKTKILLDGKDATETEFFTRLRAVRHARGT